MNLNKLNDWLQLAAALGVIAGLLLVATEIQQNAALMRAQLNSDEHFALDDLARSMQQAPLAEALEKSYVSPLELSISERIIIDGFYREVSQKVLREWIFVQRGIYVDELDIPACMFTRIVLTNEYGKLWWEDFKIFYPPTLVGPIDECASKFPPIPVLEKIDKSNALLRERLEAQQ